MAEMPEIWKHGKELASKLAMEPSGTVLRELFRVRTDHWKYSYQCCEYFTIGLFGDLDLKPERAFRLIDPAVDLVMEQTDGQLAVAAGGLLDDIIRASESTELTPHIAAKWDILMRRLSSSDGDSAREGILIAEAISRWYRRPI